MSDETEIEETTDEAAPTPVVADPELQNFNPTSDKSFHRIELWVETPRGENPSTWQWDSVLHPNKANLASVSLLPIEDARKVGFVDPTASPNCDVCLDRRYVLYELDQKNLELAQAYVMYVDAGWKVELCPACGPEFVNEVGNLGAISTFQRNCNIDYADGSAVKRHAGDRTARQYRCHPVPNPDTWEYSNFLPERCVPINLLKGPENGYHPEAMGSSDRDAMRTAWRKKWKVPGDPTAKVKQKLRGVAYKTNSGW